MFVFRRCKDSNILNTSKIISANPYFSSASTCMFQNKVLSINFNSASSMANFGISKPTFFASAIGRE